MAKVQCGYCGYETDENIDVCPYCGHSIEKQLSLFEEEKKSDTDYEVIAESYTNFRETAIQNLCEVLGIHENEAEDILAAMPTSVVRGVNRTIAMTVSRTLTNRGIQCYVCLNGEIIPFENVNNTRFTEETVQRRTPFVSYVKHPATGDSIYNAYSGRLRKTGERSEDNPPLRRLIKK